ncbi:MAG TPA: hypothetical protein VG944_24460 [Fimbriimonas sp.]|nr:hypothetical protein [Fimbriimonas sp.]
MLAASIALGLLASPLKYRWFYLPTNLFRPEAADQAVELIHRAAKVGYNGVLYSDSKLESLSTFPDFYQKNVNRLLDAARTEKMDVIPCVLSVGYADGILAQNPSLVESLPCRHVALTVHEGLLEPDPAELYPNGDFAVTNGNAVSGALYQDGPGKTSFVDRTVTHSGEPSLRLENPGSGAETSGNCRLVRKLALQPFHQYRLSVWIKTDAFKSAGDVRAVALDPKGNSLSFQDLGVQQTQDWTQHFIVFNGLDNTDVNLYIGVWGGTKGKLWLSEISLRDAGVLNIDRRPACPVKVVDASGREVKLDLEDPQSGNIPWPGEFDFKHPFPSVKTSLKEGETVFADYYAAASTDSGKTSICLADPATAQLERKEIARVDDLLHPNGFMLCQDEMRIQGWCGACAGSGKTAGQLIADDIRRSTGFLKGKQAFVWSDMFDPFHNATDSYYLCKGSIKGSWNGLQPGTVVLNWNMGDKARQSLEFFAGKGFKQILAGYYDGPVDAIKPWMKLARATGSLEGVMYTTWQGNYKDLEAFAKAAWGS